MKILSIGDIHGFDSWKKFVKDISEYDKIIFGLMLVFTVDGMINF